MIVLLDGTRRPHKAVCNALFSPWKGWWTMDSLDSVWFGMKLGVAMIGMVMMRFAWRGIWRSKRVGDHKNR